MKSVKFGLSSRVPQGSHLGTLLFITYINDIAKHINRCNYELYVDDLKIYRKIKTDAGATLIQSDLNNIHMWCNDNDMM